MTTQTQVTPIVVTSEVELNNAIQLINESATAGAIDIRAGFSLTRNVSSITQSLVITSSNGSSVQDGGFAFLTASGGIEVSLAMEVKGSGTSTFDGSGANGKLYGLSGGALANLALINDSSLVVNAGDCFTTTAINASSFPSAGAAIAGILNNQGCFSVSYGVISNQTPNGDVGGQANEIELQYQAFLNLQPNSTFKVNKISVNLISQIGSDGSAFLDNSEELLVIGDGWEHDPGIVQGVRVNDIQLSNTGTLTCAEGGISGGWARNINNVSGVFHLGHQGTWDVANYTQSAGVLRFKIPDYSGVAPLLLVSGDVNISGGKISVSPEIFYIPPGTQSQVIKLMDVTGKLTITDLRTVQYFSGFPSGITPSLQVEGNCLYLNLSVQPAP